MASREGTAEWQGDLKEGSGTVSVASGLFDGQYSYKTRFEDGAGTNPEELIGAAHAGCYSMALSAMLSGDGHVPDSVKTTATVQLRMVDGTPTITKIDLVVRARVSGIDGSEFDEYARKAKDGCPVSRALSGVGEITLDAQLEQ